MTKVGKVLSRLWLVATLAMLVEPSLAADVAVGKPAPDFRLQDQNGEWHELGDYRGQWVTLYFYPKDDTPGCTTEACSFRDSIFAFEDIGCTVLGVSLDDQASHKAFAEKYSLPFSLLADTEGDVAKSYGVFTQYGDMNIAKRETFLVDPQGNVAMHYKRVDPETHSAQVLADLKELGAGDDGG